MERPLKTGFARWKVFGGLHPTTRRLLLARAFRSVGQGILVVDLALYLHALGWSAIEIGLVLSGAGLFGSALSLAVGVTSDRFRRKPLLLIYEGIVLLCSIAALISSRPAILASAIIAAGFGRGANGAAGPFSPAEQAWLAEQVAPRRRGMIFSLNSAMGFYGMGVGAFLAVLPEVFARWFYHYAASSYRPLFALVLAASVANVWLIAGAKEEYHGSGRTMEPGARQRQAELRRRENSILAKLVFLNSFNGMAIGLTGPLISYWFALRFQVGPGAIAPVMAATFIFTGMASMIAGKLSEQVGLVKSVVWSRVVGLMLLAILPIMPSYWMAASAFLMRSIFNRGTVGSRQALTVGLVRDERRGLATSLNAVSMQAPQSVGPSIAGYMIHAGLFALPFYVAALLQGVYIAAYGLVFKNYNMPRDES